MNRKLILFFIVNNLLFAQISQAQINRLSNEQLDLLREELQSQNTEDVVPSVDKVEISPIESPIVENNLFGYDYFDREINFYDNIPTPQDFKLGPGDEIILSLWGESNFRQSFTVNTEGLIYFENIGFINISNKTLKEAENILIDELSKIYSTLSEENKSTQLMLELGRIKSINVYFSGQVNNPGLSLVHPFSDIISALIQAGGINSDGSLRQIKLIRSDETIYSFDLYSFFVGGKGDFKNIRIIDGDIIHVPVVNKRVKIEGEVINPKFYELLNTDTLSNLVNYSGGLTALASSKAIVDNILTLQSRISDDNAKVSQSVSLLNSKQISLSNGSRVNILPIADNDKNVTIFGRVVAPGDYPAYKLDISSKDEVLKNMTLKNLLDMAGGFDDEVFRKTVDDNITILRKDEEQFYGKEYIVNYKNSDAFSLKVNDKVFVYEKPNYRNSFTYTIKGEVNKPGTYSLKEGLTLEAAISLAGGITEIGSINSVSVSKKLLRINEDGDELVEEQLVGNIGLDFEIADENIITILPKTNVIQVGGNVYNPGLVSTQGSTSITMSNAIELAGGYKPYSLKNNAYVVRANGQIEKANLFRGKVKRVFPGDSIFVPLDPNPQDFDAASFTADLLGILTNLVAIFAIVDNNSD